MTSYCEERLLYTAFKNNRSDVEATTSLAAAKEISLDAAEASGLSEWDGIFAIKEEQRMAPKARHKRRLQFLLPTGIDRS